eukprot:144730-Pyramimonas_sp.AAC.1
MTLARTGRRVPSYGSGCICVCPSYGSGCICVCPSYGSGCICDCPSYGSGCVCDCPSYGSGCVCVGSVAGCVARARALLVQRLWYCDGACASPLPLCRNGICFDRIVGFEELNGKDDFKTAHLEMRLKAAGDLKPNPQTLKWPRLLVLSPWAPPP